MSNTVMIVALIIGLVASLVISTKCNINAGILGLIVAWIVGGWMGKLSVTTLVGYWPTSVMFIAITTTLFFGVARENGTLTLFANKVMYATRKFPWFIPIALYLTSWVVGAAGAGAMAAQIALSAIGFAIAGQTGMHPLLVILAVFMGGGGGGGMFWSSEGANRIAFYTQAGVAEDAVTYSAMAYSLYSFIIFTFIFLIGYVVFKGWKIDTKDLSMEKPAPYDPKQKSTLVLIAICLGLVIGSAVWKCFWPSDLSKYLAGQLSIQMVCLAGFVVAFFLDLADSKAVMKRIPWDLILNIGGMCVMIKVLINCGITDMVANVFAGDIPKFIIPILFFIMAGVITLFSNFTVIYPLLMPLVPVVAAATGCNSVTLFTAMCLGSFTPGISPFSTGGACCLSGCPDEKARQELVPKVFIMSLVIIVIICLLLLTPIISFLPDCL